MSEEAAVSRKEKRAQRDAQRHKGNKKRKREEDAPEEDLQQDFIPLTGDAAAEDAIEAQLKARSDADSTPRKKIKALKSSKTKKRDTAAADDGDEPPTSKKRRKVKSEQSQEQQEEEEDTTTTAPTKYRFILFIGNLPYSTTDASLQNYFKSIAPFILRHRTDPKTKKSKGFAFLEFENYDRMQTCIKLYHHSMFNPEQHSASSAATAEKKGKDRGARRINVELTAGGGGNKEGRMEKIKAKNVKLDEQRKRKAEAERKEKEKEQLKEEKESKGKGKKKDGGGSRKKDANDGKTVDAQLREQHTVKSEDASQIHPSRLARVLG